MKVRSILDRVYSDFLMPSRLGHYQSMLETMLQAGYRIWPIADLWRVIRTTGRPPDGRHVVLRHDIDTDWPTAARMWAIERSLGVAGSYYFRLSTLNVQLMHDIAAGGGEASYHFEELASLAKRHRIRDPREARRRLGEAREDFQRNLDALRRDTGLPMTVVASHGDFVNRRLGIPNTVLLDDMSLRESAGVELEVYDRSFMDHLTSVCWDTLHPHYWDTEDPLQPVARGDQLVSVLVHPRHWHARRAVNARDNVWRVAEGLAYRTPSFRAWTFVGAPAMAEAAELFEGIIG